MGTAPAHYLPKNNYELVFLRTVGSFSTKKNSTFCIYIWHLIKHGSIISLRIAIHNLSNERLVMNRINEWKYTAFQNDHGLIMMLPQDSIYTLSLSELNRTTFCYFKQIVLKTSSRKKFISFWTIRALHPLYGVNFISIASDFANTHA